MFDPWAEYESTASPTNALQLTTQPSPSDLLLVIFIHGFKGDDKTFGVFPQRVQHILSQSLPNTVIESIVFPVYEVRYILISPAILTLTCIGALDKRGLEAVARFVEWLTTLTVEKEQGAAGSAKIVLCGHSMGGLLAADSLLELSRSLKKGESGSLWPRIIACISFDTPYLGLQPSVLKHGVTKAAEVVSGAQAIGSTVFGALAGLGAGKAAEKATSTTQTPQSPQTGWSRWASPAAYAIGGAVLAGAAAGSAWYRREGLGQGYEWVSDHMKFVGNLWDEKVLQSRINTLIELEKSHGILFRTLYVLLPPTPPQHMSSRTFILAPKLYTPAASHFSPAKNGLAADEIKGHTGMFAAATNDGYYELGLTATKLIQDAVASHSAKA
ncbi:hypothetical protein M378DRAFT_175531 [Amanita muscaria Koide BX008]|uniref:DUF676 domain-containing protein n=1 Tax=Amanita muscaria (strain Koide BX008) TaxID=946122 RepID=A0A0C2TSG5_AMAMK|nr:hypothetical protein M378DRAFT_175531 [Amanita muscaria Koide BX008]